jgi:hypothetical protein
MRQGVAAGELRADLDPAELARAFLIVQNGAVYLWLSDPEAFSLRGSAEALADIMLHGLAGDDKNASIVQALRLYPCAAEFLTLKKHDGRAEALLMAGYLRDQHKA